MLRTAHAAGNPLGDKSSLIGFITRCIHTDRQAITRFCPQSFARALFIFGNDTLGRCQDRAGIAVILLKLDHSCTRVILLKAEDIFKISPTPTVNTLPVITYNADILLLPYQQTNDFILGGISILVFVNQNILKLRLPLAADAWLRA